LDALTTELRRIVGAQHVPTDRDDTAPYATDWTRRWRGATPLVARPGDVDEVAAIVRACRAHRVALVPQGGNTGLVGGSVPLAGEIVLSTRRLERLGDVDALGMRVVAGAGVTLEALQHAVAPAGLRFGVDLAARGTATIGGMVATNAGGTHVVRHGTMRVQLLGVEAVLGDGSVIRHLRGLRKDNTGYDLASLLCGSEGTLGVVTAAALRLIPTPRTVAVALIGFATVDAAVRASAQLQHDVPGIEAVELMLRDGLRLAGAHLDVTLPAVAEAPVTVLVEIGVAESPVDVLAAAVQGLEGRVGEPAVAIDARSAGRLWRLRDAHPEAAAALGVVHKLDVTLPAPALAAFVDQVHQSVRARAPEATCLVYGHLGDGNLHVNVVGPGVTDEIDDAVLDLVVEAGGSISAEHGIGTAKRRWLEQVRAPGDIAAFRAIKRALDPDGILNPNVLLA
jgi:FAD/FMN-containing dehydrogenase